MEQHYSNGYSPRTAEQQRNPGLFEQLQKEQEFATQRKQAGKVKRRNLYLSGMLLSIATIILSIGMLWGVWASWLAFGVLMMFVFGTLVSSNENN